MATKNWIVAAFIATLAIGGSLGLAYMGLARLGSKPLIYTVVKGDTLFEIAQAHGVTVEQLRIWNELEGDLIEIGDQIEIFHVETAPEAAIKPLRSSRKAPPGSLKGGTDTEEEPVLKMPDAKDCLSGPALDGTADQQMAASEGLSFDQISGSMNDFLPNVLPCIQQAAEAPEETLMLEFTVACSGLVTDVGVSSFGDWSPDVARCVTDTLGYTPFPAHALPDGEQFSFPLRFTPG